MSKKHRQTECDAPGVRVYILDHGNSVSSAIVLGESKSEYALKVRDILMIRNKSHCYPSERAALLARFKTISQEIAVKQQEWARLVDLLNPQETT